MRLILDAPDLASARAAAPDALRPLLTPAAFDAVKGVAGAVDHTDRGEGALGRLREMFDRAAAVSPEAAAALYSLGDPGRLAAATAEVAGWLRSQELHRPGGRVLEVGCGAGRFLRELARDADLVLGVELSPVLARTAAASLTGCAGVVLADGGGAPFAAPGAFDLVLYADSFPYVVQAGGDLPARHLADARRALNRAGRLVVLNWSYRGDLARDADEAGALAAAAGLVLERVMRPAFSLWDGTSYVFAPAPGSP